MWHLRERGFCWEILKETDHRYNVGELDGRVWSGFMQLRVRGSRDYYGNGHSFSMESGEFID